jgi:choice-of-anchor A domain-containing protein
MRSLSLAIGTALTLVTGLAAVAAPTTAVILADYNAVIFGGGSTTADIEGAAIIGGNFSGATVYNNPGTNSSNPVLTVFGDTSGNPINLNNGGSAFVGGKKGAIINFNGGGKYVSTGAGGGISEFRTPLTQLSTSLSLLNATSVLPPAGNNEVIKATPGKDGIAVFNVTAADLAAIPSYKIDMNGAKSVFFNVTGASVTFNANNESGTTGANNIIWNFVDATSVDFKTLIAGTVLAPDAHVTNGNQIDGNLIAASWSGTGELHNWGFDGCLPTDTAVAEPSTIAMLGAGCFGLGLFHRRRVTVRA